MKLVYLAGPPATGKSTLMAALTEGLRREPSGDSTLPHDRLYRGVELVAAEMGRIRPHFPGTDTLAYSIGPRAREWISRVMFDLVLGEGDRLAKLPFFNAAADSGYEVHLVTLQARMSVLDERCEARGSKQSKSWRLGRATTVTRLAAYAEAAGIRVHYLDAEKNTAEMVRTLCAEIPALESLGSARGNHVQRKSAV